MTILLFSIYYYNKSIKDILKKANLLANAGERAMSTINDLGQQNSAVKSIAMDILQKVLRCVAQKLKKQTASFLQTVLGIRSREFPIRSSAQMRDYIMERRLLVGIVIYAAIPCNFASQAKEPFQDIIWHLNIFLLYVSAHNILNLATVRKSIKDKLRARKKALQNKQ